MEARLPRTARNINLKCTVHLLPKCNAVQCLLSIEAYRSSAMFKCDILSSFSERRHGRHTGKKSSGMK